MLVEVAASRTISFAWRVVPTKRTLPPLATVSSMNAQDLVSASWVLPRSMMVTPWRWSKMNGFERGFQRLVWCPKCTPASSRSFAVMLMLMLILIYVSGDTQVGRRAALRSMDVGWLWLDGF